jgi:uncharacterized protein YigE (DUF2233 family)
VNTKLLLATSLFVCATSALAQTYGSPYRAEYEKEANGPHGECRVDWRSVTRGIDYRAITCLGSRSDLDLHVVRIDTDRWKLDTHVSDGTYAPSVARQKNAPFSINANFFDAKRNPIGVVVRSGAEVSGTNKSSWQSIFYVTRDGDARITLPSKWSKERKNAWMAVQAGPRLVIGGHTARVHQSYTAARAGVCIQKSGALVFFSTPQDRKFDMYEIARIARRAEIDGGLECQEAMLFDGGHSAQIYASGSDSSPVSISGDPVPVFVYATAR